MAAYLIARIEVTDWSRYQEYTRRTPEVIARYGGRFIVRGGKVLSLEGPPENGRIVVLEFPSLEQAQKFYGSPDYAEVKAFRAGAATGQFIAVEGFTNS